MPFHPREGTNDRSKKEFHPSLLLDDELLAAHRNWTGGVTLLELRAHTGDFFLRVKA